ncbi:hypothetical protein QFC21_006975 [Naganishia friedmannii]|uniref:Uncharacterized protein n=1 Tax=Naganishia friedmannii TaxID=89922 RepID=A0ACC2UYF1_9TREE|nr:hypothetical protein QFC21_006975 [Naganishia friedmannii]
MVSYAFSAVLTGLVFLLLGYFRLGALIGYFPRHILVGCIGGVGVFLLETGLEVSRGLKEEGFEYNLNTLKVFFANGHAIALWTIPLGLAILLRIITHKFHHQLIFPSYFFVIPCVFYIVVLIGGWKIGHLRETGWIFDVGGVSQPWYTFYTLFDLHKFNWKAFWACIPTQMALVFFGILHVPLNVPALGVSLQEDNVDLDRELVAHGISNMGAGLLGTVPNYLCYVNTVLFYRVGGGSRLSGLMLAGATAVIMSIGPSVVAYLPVMVVGALIFVLGIDLVKEAVWDTRHRVNRMEYITIWAITIGMTVFDFVIGLLLGIILASMFFVIQNSRRKPIRAVFSGASAKSTVRRPHPQREFLQAVGKQTLVMKLQGFLFFGTITKVEEEIRKLLDLAAWESNPIRFLIVDFALVPGLDFSAAEAFVRLQRLLSQKDVLLILCGANPDGLVGRALQAVDLWADQEGTRVEVFDGLNSALEWCENAYLTAYYSSTAMARREHPTTHGVDFPKVSKPPFAMSDAFHNSPRRTHVTAAGVSNLPDGVANSPNHLAPVSGDHKSGSSRANHGQSTGSSLTLKQPLPILLQTFSDYFDDPTQNPHDFFFNIVPYLSPVHTKAGETIWERDDMADALYLIESGCLRATYEYEDHCELIQETMVAGTVAGELTMLSASKRNATVVAERDSKLWKLDQKGLEKMEKERPEIARRFVKIVLKVANEEADVLFNHLVAVLS